MNLPPNDPFALQCVSGPDTGQSIVLLPQTRLTLGRSAQANIPVSDPQVANLHLLLLFDGQRVHFRTVDHGRRADSGG